MGKSSIQFYLPEITLTNILQKNKFFSFKNSSIFAFMEQTIINSNGYSVFIGNGVFETIRSFLMQYEFKENKIFVLVDENSRKYCLPRLMSNIQLFQHVNILEVNSGEDSKKIDTCSRIWQKLNNEGADRKSVFINLGGGVVSDMGGFIASCYKRGIRYVNIPTSLLAMVDASIGGKVGIDLNGLKNQVGLFSNPQVVFIIPEFIDTLPERQIKTGFAEIIKHALIYEKQYWNELSQKPYDSIKDWQEIINWSVEIKNYFVMEDPLETGFRRVLNFGHTIGHAVETYSMLIDDALTHGEAIAIGLICESYLSNKLAGLPDADLNEIISYISTTFPYFKMSESGIEHILDYMKQDKKNSKQQINFTLLTSIGNSMINQQVDVGLIIESLNFYRRLNE